MHSVLRHILFLVIACQISTSWACSTTNCVETDSWQLGVAIGAGVKTNPLVDGDNIPLVILPDIAWYGEKAYFDNGELGYQWYSSTKQAFESFIQIDKEMAFFEFNHPANIFVLDGKISSMGPESPQLPSDNTGFPFVSTDEIKAPEERTISQADIAKRKWAINGGIRWHYFHNDMEWKVSFQNDMSGVHKGSIISANHTSHWLLADTAVSLQLGADWKSAKLVDYYYGIDAQDTDNQALFYKGQAGIETFVSLNVKKPITVDWYWVANLQYRKLPSGMTASPLVKENITQSLFIGVAYRY